MKPPSGLTSAMPMEAESIAERKVSSLVISALTCRRAMSSARHSAASSSAISMPSPSATSGSQLCRLATNSLPGVTVTSHARSLTCTVP